VTKVTSKLTVARRMIGLDNSEAFAVAYRIVTAMGFKDASR
jgi:hypothetical protein